MFKDKKSSIFDAETDANVPITQFLKDMSSNTRTLNATPAPPERKASEIEEIKAQIKETVDNSKQ